MARAPFFRIGQAVRIPVTKTSAATQFDLAGKMPNVPDLTFMFINNCPFDIRLEGTPMAQNGANVGPFQQVTSATGWLIMARTIMGPFTSKKPMLLSAQAFAAPGLSLPDDAWFQGNSCFLELVYGRGE